MVFRAKFRSLGRVHTIISHWAISLGLNSILCIKRNEITYNFLCAYINRETRLAKIYWRYEACSVWQDRWSWMSRRRWKQLKSTHIVFIKRYSGRCPSLETVYCKNTRTWVQSFSRHINKRFGSVANFSILPYAGEARGSPGLAKLGRRTNFRKCGKWLVSPSGLCTHIKSVPEHMHIKIEVLIPYEIFGFLVPQSPVAQDGETGSG